MSWPEIFRYVLVGSIVAAGYVALGAYLHSVLGLALGKANFVAIMAMHPFSFLGHRFITFRAAGPWWPSLLRFIAMAMLSTAISILLMATYQYFAVAPAVALFINSAAVPIVTYLVMKLWVFAD